MLLALLTNIFFHFAGIFENLAVSIASLWLLIFNLGTADSGRWFPGATTGGGWYPGPGGSTSDRHGTRTDVQHRDIPTVPGMVQF